MKHPLFFGALGLPLLVACGSVDTTGPSTPGAGGATTSTSATSTTTSSTSSAASAGASSSTGGIACPPACEAGFTCCGGACVNVHNDIHNCGVCAKTCAGDNPFCGEGVCQDPPCSGTMVCKGSEFCCGAECCAGGLLCCDVPGPGAALGLKCTTPKNGTCPAGCPLCL